MSKRRSTSHLNNENQQDNTCSSNDNDDGSSSDSSVGDYLKKGDEIDLSSSFFQTKKEDEKSDFKTLEKKMFMGIKKLSDSDSDSFSDECSSEDKTDSHPTQEKFSFSELNEYKRKLEEAKACVKKYEVKKRNEENNLDILHMLAVGERKGDTNSSALDTTADSDEYDSEDEMDWEEVHHKEEKQTRTEIPKDGIQITVEMPNAVRKKKGVDLIAAMKRRINRIKKENQIYIHKVHLLCWIAHGNFVNSVLNNENLLGMALSLLPSEQCYPPERADLSYMEQITKWYGKLMKLNEKHSDLMVPLLRALRSQINKKEAHNKRDFVLIFICILRSLGLQCRLVFSLQCVPLRPPNSELCSLSTKEDSKRNSKKTTDHDKSVSSQSNLEKPGSSKVIVSKIKSPPKIVVTKANSKKSNTQISAKSETKSSAKLNIEKKNFNSIIRSKSDSEIKPENIEKEVETKRRVSRVNRKSLSDLKVESKPSKSEMSSESESNASLKKRKSPAGRKTSTDIKEIKSEVTVNNKSRKSIGRTKSETDSTVTESEKEVDSKTTLRRTRKLVGGTKPETDSTVTESEKEIDSKTTSRRTRKSLVNNEIKSEESVKNKSRKSTGEIKTETVTEKEMDIKPTSRRTRKSIGGIKTETDSTVTESEIEIDSKTTSRRTINKLLKTDSDSDVTECKKPKLNTETKELLPKKESTDKNENNKKDELELINKKISRRASTSSQNKIEIKKETNSKKTPIKKESKISQVDGTDDSPSHPSTSKNSPNLKKLKNIPDNMDYCISSQHPRKVKTTANYKDDSEDEFQERNKSPEKNPNKQIKIKDGTTIKKNQMTDKHQKKVKKPESKSNTVEKKCNPESDEDFKPKVIKVKQKIKPKSEIDRRVLSTDEDEPSDKKKKKGVDVWLEVFLEAEEKWISVDVIKGQVHCVAEIYSRATHPVSYVLAWNNNRSIKDISARYCQFWNTVTRKLRADKSWWEQTLKPYAGIKTVRDREEDQDLARMHLEKPLPKTIGEYKNHPLYALKRHLLKFEAIYPPDAVTLGFIRNEPVYARECVHCLHSREIWVKHAKVVKPGEKPYKIVKARPKYDRLTGNCITDQPLEIFGPWQVEDYVPPTAENGIVPRNPYGNVELFKPCMLPIGTVHIQLPGLNRVARKLQIDCAPALVGFDYRTGGCYPAYDGFIVCEEFKETLIAAWEQEQVEAEKREQEKIDKRVYGNWRKLIRGLLIREKLKAKYDFGEPSQSAKGGKKKSKGPKFVAKRRRIMSGSESSD